ncbi:Glycosyltransferase, GT2 family [Pedobacter westerhofensis]|uniref:Glycosyltransferase, GT2 family n=1 Tax=Pedobacter westerhofensis TaxID=425512 RepID=A0A521CAS5_9SPHI|nr:glycosyltransferase family 2 protein [Pedobacter westerhofensis]SMO55911.1 Glycosyltransferase, GT2 family [Pedobacter westerhofensis]
MKLSIITVVFNNERTILDAINSVSKQSYGDIEYIIIDGKSTDRTISIINSCSDRVFKIVSELDDGIYDAMNKGIALATGDVIGILNSDDVYADDRILDKVMQVFAHHDDADIVYGDLVYVREDNLDEVARTWHSQPYYDHYFEDGHVPPHPSLFLRRSVYATAGMFNLSFRLAADYEFMLRIFKKFDFKSIYMPGVLVKMRLGGATNKNWKNIIKGNIEILKAWKVNELKAPSSLMLSRMIKKLAQFKK